METKRTHGERVDGVDLHELEVICTELMRRHPKLENVDGVSLLMVAIQIQRNAILNDTAIINGNIADALSDLATAEAMADYIPGEKKN